MYMDGFHWIHDTTCVIYLFPQWVLSSQGKFVAACVGSLFFGLLVEYIISRRRVVATKFVAGYCRLAASAGFYGLQLTVGYVIMLVVMTYSIPLFLCCVLGLVGGHVLFNANDALLSDSSSGKSSNTVAKSDMQSADATNTNDEDGASGTPNDIITSLPECRCNNSSDSIAYNEVTEPDDNHGVPEGISPCCQNVF